MRRVGFWRRAAALCVDLFVAVVLGWGLGLPPYVYFAGRGRTELAQYLLDLIATATLLVYTSTEVWLRRSPGKMLVGLVIAYPDGAPADRWSLLLRWSTKFSAYLVGFVSILTFQPTALAALGGFMNAIILVGCLQALDEDKRTWHDQWARTAVFRRIRQASPPPPLPPPPLPR